MLAKLFLVTRERGTKEVALIATQVVMVVDGLQEVCEWVHMLALLKVPYDIYV